MSPSTDIVESIKHHYPKQALDINSVIKSFGKQLDNPFLFKDQHRFPQSVIDHFFFLYFKGYVEGKKK